MRRPGWRAPGAEGCHSHRLAVRPRPGPGSQTVPGDEMWVRDYQSFLTKQRYRFGVWQWMGGHSNGAPVPAPGLGLQMSQQSVADVVLSQGSRVQRDGVVGGRELMDQ